MSSGFSSACLVPDRLLMIDEGRKKNDGAGAAGSVELKFAREDKESCSSSILSDVKNSKSYFCLASSSKFIFFSVSVNRPWMAAHTGLTGQCFENPHFFLSIRQIFR